MSKRSSAKSPGHRGRESSYDLLEKNDAGTGKRRRGIADAQAKRTMRQRTARGNLLPGLLLRRLAGGANRRLEIHGRRVSQQRPQRVARDAENGQPSDETTFHKPHTIRRLLRRGQNGLPLIARSAPDPRFAR